MVSVVARDAFYGFRRWFFMVSVVARNVFYGFRRWFFMVSGCYRTAAVSPMETVKQPPERFQDELSIYIYIYNIPTLD